MRESLSDLRDALARDSLTPAVPLAGEVRIPIQNLRKSRDMFGQGWRR
jgi:hypothetical protein